MNTKIALAVLFCTSSLAGAAQTLVIDVTHAWNTTAHAGDTTTGACALSKALIAGAAPQNQVYTLSGLDLEGDGTANDTAVVTFEVTTDSGQIVPGGSWGYIKSDSGNLNSSGKYVHYTFTNLVVNLTDSATTGTGTFDGFEAMDMALFGNGDSVNLNGTTNAWSGSNNPTFQLTTPNQTLKAEWAGGSWTAGGTSWKISLEAEDPAPAELVAHYEAEGNTEDSLPAGQHGTLIGGLDYGTGFGTGQTFSFNGTDAAVELPNIIEGAFSIAFWMRGNTPGEESTDQQWWNGNGLVDGSVAGVNNDFGVTLVGHRVAFGIGNPDTTLYSQTLVTDNVWHHVVASYGSGSMKLYIDGLLETSFDTPMGPRDVPANIRIGSLLGDTQFFKGYIDDVRIFSGSLTAEEVAGVRITTGDIDGDGQPDADEAVVGTDWGDPTSRFIAGKIQSGTHGMVIEIEGRRGRRYWLDKKTNLVDGVWQEVAALESLEKDASTLIEDPVSTEDSAYFQIRAARGTSHRPNIAVIVIDDMGYGDLGAYAHAASDTWTPNLDTLATNGVRFTHGYVTGPVCSPSRAGWNTGRNQVEWNKSAGWSPGLPTTVQTLAEMLKEEGYLTCKVGKNDYGTHLGQFDTFSYRDYPGNHGYDRFFGFNAHGHSFWWNYEGGLGVNNGSGHAGPLQNHNTLTDPAIAPTTTAFTGADDPDHTGDPDYYLTKLLTDQAIDFVQSVSTNEEPFYLALTYNSVHNIVAEVPQTYLDQTGARLGITMPAQLGRYDPTTSTSSNPSRFVDFYNYWANIKNMPGTTDAEKGENMRKYYLANLLALDENIGRILAELPPNTLVIVFSDNGGPPENGSDNGGQMGSKYTLFEGGIRVPFLMSWPGHLPTETVYSNVVSTLDVVPTCLQAADAPTRPNLRGHSLLDPVAQARPVVPGGRTLFWKWQGNWAIRKGDWKLVQSDGSDRLSGPGVFFDSDITGKLSLFKVTEDNEMLPNDQADTETAIKDELQALWNAWYDSL